MALTSTILIYGHDPILLETRRWVLQKAGFEVTTVSELSAVVKAINGIPRLVILCHTLTAAERSAAITAATSQRPAVRTLSISMNHQNHGKNGISGETLDSLAGAEGLIAAAKKMAD